MASTLIAMASNLDTPKSKATKNLFAKEKEAAGVP